jgi:hypothetical protein
LTGNFEHVLDPVNGSDCHIVENVGQENLKNHECSNGNTGFGMNALLA